MIYRRKFLVADDDPDIGIMIKTMLEFDGYSVTVIGKASNAPAHLREGGFDLLIMDMLMSEANGAEICSQIKNDASTSHIPVIMISGHPEAERFSKEAGADDFISKPFEMQQILAKVAKYAGN